MADSHRFKIYRGAEYVASAKYAQDAVLLLHYQGTEGRIKYGHRKVVLTYAEIDTDSIEATIERLDANYQAWKRAI